MKYLDANVFIDAISGKKSDAKTISAQNILYKVSEGAIQACTSLLTWDEIAYVLGKTLGAGAANVESRKILEFPNLKFLDVKPNIIFTAQELVSRHGIRPRDAIHAASCLENGIEEIITDDSDFDGVVGLRRIKIEKAV